MHVPLPYNTVGDTRVHVHANVPAYASAYLYGTLPTGSASSGTIENDMEALYEPLIPHMYTYMYVCMCSRCSLRSVN